MRGRMTARRGRFGAGAVVLSLLLTAGCGLREPPAAELTKGAGVQSEAGMDLGRTGGLTLSAALLAGGVVLPPRGNVYAAVVEEGPGGPRYVEFEAGGGASATDFWPASSLKLLAAAGALEFLHRLGFSGQASVTFDDGAEWQVRELYDAAVEDSDNEAYDRLVSIAGVDWLNQEFLTSENGFPLTVIQKAYGSLGQVRSDPMTIREAQREIELPSRPASSDYGVPDDGNRSNLREMTDSVRRVVLHDALPFGDRFAIDDDDVAGLRSGLLAAEGFIEPGAVAVLGRDLLVYDKPGYVLGADCVDVAYVRDRDGHAFLLGVSAPDDGLECATLTTVARSTLEFLLQR